MKKLILSATALALATLSTAANAATYHYQKQAVTVFLDSTRPCVLFRLDGVATADPVVPNSAWFVLQKSHLSFAELFAMLLTSKASNRPIDVQTTGTQSNSCSGLAVVDIIVIQ